MKKGFFTLLVLGAMSAQANVNYGDYCTKYIKGELTDGVKPSILEDFEPSEGEFLLADNTTKVKSLIFKLSPALEKEGGSIDVQSIVGKNPDDAEVVVGDKNISKTTTVHDAKKNVEIQTLTVKRPNKRGKMIKDYSLVITRDLDGRVLSIKKNHRLLDFKAPEKLTMIYKNDTCIPNEQFKKLKREFNTTMCRELEEFFDANPVARECAEKGYDLKIRGIVEKYDRGLNKVVDMFRSKKYGGSYLSAKALGDCADAGLSEAVENDELWKEQPGSSSSSVSSGSSSGSN
jgi:hypothetical protein